MARRIRPAPARDPWQDAPVGELQDPLLARWFVLLGLVMVPLAVVVAVVALALAGGQELAVEDRRPPPSASLTHEVGELVVGDSPAVAHDAPCAELGGVGVAGTEADQQLLSNAVAGLCNVAVDATTTAALNDFTERGGVIRFAVFEATGVDSTATLDADHPVILLNGKFAQMGRPRWIAPVIAHDAVILAGDPASAETALRAREVEDEVCRRLLGTEQPSRGCEDAAELLALDDPLSALRRAGYR